MTVLGSSPSRTRLDRHQADLFQRLVIELPAIALHAKSMQ